VSYKDVVTEHRVYTQGLHTAVISIASTKIRNSQSLSSRRKGSKRAVLRISETPHKRLRAVGWPERLVIELCSVPDDLVKELRDLDRVRTRTWAVGLEGPAA
jgi:hypothetical protein